MIFDFFDSPELLDIQRTGFYHFLNQGIPQLLAKEFPIKVKNGSYSLELCLNEKNVKLIAPEDDPRDCILKMKTYNCKLYAQVKIVCKRCSPLSDPLSVNQEKIVYQSLPEWVLLGQIPMMTKRGHFIINGSPRVIVHQVVRAPGIYFQKLIKKDDQNKARFYGDIIPLKGVWVRLQMSKKGRVEAKFKKGKKVEVELLQKCLQVIENQTLPVKGVAKQSFARCTNQIKPSRLLYDEYAKLLDKKKSRAESKAEHDAFVHTYDKLYRTTQDKELEEWQKKKKNQDFFKGSFSSNTHLFSGTKQSFARSKQPPCLSDRGVQTLPAPCSLPFKEGPGAYRSPSLGEKICTACTVVARAPSLPLWGTHGHASTGTKGTKGASKSSYVRKALASLCTCNSFGQGQGVAPKVHGQENVFKRKKCSENLFATFKLESRYDLGLLGREKINNKFGLRFNTKTLQKTAFHNFGNFRQFCTGSGIDQNSVFNENANTQLTALDLCSATLWLYKLRKGEESTDDIDHSQNRRVKTSGELLQTQFENGVYRLKNLLSTKLQEWRGDLSSSYFSSMFKFSCKTRSNSKNGLVNGLKKAELSYFEKKSFLTVLSRACKSPPKGLHQRCTKICVPLCGKGYTFTQAKGVSKYKASLACTFVPPLRHARALTSPVLPQRGKGCTCTLPRRGTGARACRAPLGQKGARRFVTALRAVPEHRFPFGVRCTGKKGEQKCTTPLASCKSPPKGLHQRCTLRAVRARACPKGAKKVLGEQSGKKGEKGVNTCKQNQLLKKQLLSVQNTALSRKTRVQSKAVFCKACTTPQKTTSKMVPEWENQIEEKQTHQISYKFSAKELFSTKPITGALREFFGSNPLSQYMDQTNPLAEITHKRRISSLGIGGVSRESAGMAIRGIHPTHYGRICPIETPEGKNAGLVNSLAFYTKVDKAGFLKTPYYRVFKGQIQSSLGFSFCSAREESLTGLQIAPSDLQKSSNNVLRTKFSTPESVPVRVADNFLDVFKKENPYKVQLIAISPIQMISVATSLIPFLEHNDANRALMGSNMQRQAVPLMISERPVVGTGLESTVIVESGHITESQTSGFASHVAADKVIIDSLLYAKKERCSDKYKCIQNQATNLTLAKQECFKEVRFRRKKFCLSLPTKSSYKAKRALALRALKGQQRCTPLFVKQGQSACTFCVPCRACPCVPQRGNEGARGTKGQKGAKRGNKRAKGARQVRRFVTSLVLSPIKQSVGLAKQSFVSDGLSFANKSSYKQSKSSYKAKRALACTFGARPYKSSPLKGACNPLCPVGALTNRRFVCVPVHRRCSGNKGAKRGNKGARRAPTLPLWGTQANLRSARGLQIKDLYEVHAPLLQRGTARAYKSPPLGLHQRCTKICVPLFAPLGQQRGTHGVHRSCPSTFFAPLGHARARKHGKRSLRFPKVHVHAPSPSSCPSSKGMGMGMEMVVHLCCPSTGSPSGQGARARKARRPSKKYKQKQSFFISTVSNLTTFSRSNQNTCITEKPLIREFDWIQKGDILSDCSASHNGELAVGKNVLLAYIPWEGYNFEDAIVISERLVREHVYTSLHIERYVFQAQDLKDGNEWFTKHLPGVEAHSIQHLEESGLPKIGSFLQEGDIIVGKIRYLNKKPSSPYERLLCDILGEKNFAARNKSLYVPKGVEARVIYHKVISLFDNDPENKVRPIGAAKTVHLFLGEKRVIQVGDKISGRHGNKGVISTILPRQDMPYLPDGTPIDIILNPLGVPSRMNVGQVLECLLGLAASYLNQNFKIAAFDERYGVEASKSIVFLKLYQARLLSGQNWLFQVAFPGKTRLVDGRSGECFDQWITVGRAYILKLIHMVSEKIHARSTGPYALITQQPLRGRSNKGGQRLGEMEVWALEGFGAAYTLQELLTKKSDDFFGRKQIVDSIIPSPASIIDTLKPSLRVDRNRNILGHPEIFKVLLCELQALCLDLGVYILTPESFQRSFLGRIH